MLSAETSDFLAICLLVALALGLAGWMAVLLRRSPFTPVQSCLYAINYLLTRLLWRARIKGKLPIPPDQGAVLICNHRCPLDPSFLAITTSRAVHWMVAKEYCESPLLGSLLRTCEVIPVQRGVVDLPAVREAIRLVERGEIVGLFPEGRINTEQSLLLPGQPGAAMIALKAGAPVVPCYIHGAPYDGTTLGCLLMPASVRLVIGSPIDTRPYGEQTDRREAQSALTCRFLHEIACLAGRPDFQPQLARRGNRAEVPRALTKADDPRAETADRL
jgi:1-acyl-sn-glycerol-3-phosphate acyltransferase